MHPNRTLIIFAKLPRSGGVKTRLGREIGMDEACALYDTFARHAFSLADELAKQKVTVALHYAEGATGPEINRWVGRAYDFSPQVGETLGDKMQAAFSDAFGKGATQAVIIGTDVPELDTATVLRGFAELDAHEICVGPSTDGGYYLLGMCTPGYDLFSGITWSTGTVFRETIERIERMNLHCAILPEFSDIDTLQQYQAFLKRRGGK